jgi:putative sterol carrier protein
VFNHFFYFQVPRLLKEIISELPDDVTFSFDVLGKEGGGWQITRRGNEIFISNIDNTPKDCILRCQDVILKQILNKKVDPMIAFLEGNLKLEGDVGLALQLHKTLAA